MWQHTPITEQLTVEYENEAHRRFADLLIANGFRFSLSPTFKVGLVFRHAVKLHVVKLVPVEDDSDDESYDPSFRILARPKNNARENPLPPSPQDYDVPMYPDHYSEFEWTQLQGDKPDNYTFLARELYLWLKVRPRSLNSQIRLDTPG